MVLTTHTLGGSEIVFDRSSDQEKSIQSRSKKEMMKCGEAMTKYYRELNYNKYYDNRNTKNSKSNISLNILICKSNKRPHSLIIIFLAIRILRNFF